MLFRSNFDLVECFSENNHCVITDVCKLSKVLDNAREAFFEVLRQVTLADLVKSRKALESALMPLPQKSTINFYPKAGYAARKNTKR